MSDAPLLDLIDDICRNKHGGNPQSEAANRVTRKTKDRARIYAWVHARGLDGATCDEACRALEMLTQTGSARFSDMKKDGDLIETAGRRETSGGRCKAAVCVTRGVLNQIGVGT